MRPACALFLYLPLAVSAADTRPEAKPAAQIRKLVPSAAGMSRAAFENLARAAAPPRLEQFENQSLTAFLLHRDFAGKKPERKHLRWTNTGPANPASLANEIARPAPKWLAALAPPATVIHADRITKLTCTVDGDRATGTVWFRVPDLYEGDVDYVARWHGEAWGITEFLLPGYKARLVRNDKGLWRHEPLKPTTK